MAKKKSYKPAIISTIFMGRPRDENGHLLATLVTKDDIEEALEVARNAGLLQKGEGQNEANFFKDIIRKDDAHKMWPPNVLAAGYTAKQVTGQGNVFEFVRLETGQTDPFPNPYLPDASLTAIPIQTASVNSIARSMGMRGESWMIQVMAQVKMLETHFSIVSPRHDRIQQIEHLQIGKKGSQAEIDSLYMSLEKHENVECRALITCEAKQIGERIIPEQIVQQVVEAAKIGSKKALSGKNIELIIPCAVKNLGESKIYFVEFDAIPRASWKTPPLLKKISDAIYELRPPVSGI